MMLRIRKQSVAQLQCINALLKRQNVIKRNKFKKKKFILIFFKEKSKYIKITTESSGNVDLSGDELDKLVIDLKMFLL
jgi:hypothetical protein